MNKMDRIEGVVVREIQYCRKGEQDRKTLVIRIRGPYLIDKDAVDFRFDEGTAGCTIEFDGLSELNNEVFGVDGLHALSLAVDVDPYLKRLATAYDFYWMDGEPYFDG